MKARNVGAAALTLAGGYLALVVGARRWHQHWGATDHEITKPLPGDDLIGSSKLDSTHAITIHAPAERIWPWLAQMGYDDRAGTYSYDLFERVIEKMSLAPVSSKTITCMPSLKPHNLSPTGHPFCSVTFISAEDCGMFSRIVV